MTITEKVFGALSSISAVTDIVPLDRILVPGRHQGVVRPYIVHFPVSLEPTITHERTEALRFWDFYQVSVFADDYATGEEAALAVLRYFPGVWGSVHVFPAGGGTQYQDGRDQKEAEDAEIFHFIVEFSIAEALSVDAA